MPASPTNTAVQQLILNMAFDVSGDSGPLLENLETFTPAPPWRRVSGDTAPLRIVLVDDGGTVVDTPRRVILASGNTLSLTAKVLPTDNDLALSLTFVQAGSAGEEYYEADPGTLAVDTDVFNSQPAVSLSVDFIEKTSGGIILRQWRTGLSLLWSTTAGSVASPLYYVAYNAQSPTSPQKAQALANLGATTVGKAVFSLTNPSAVTWLRVNADNSVTALSAADTRTALGAGTGSGDLLNSGTITLANAGKVPVITAANTLGAGVSYDSVATASTLVLRDGSGGIAAVNADFSGDLTVTGDINFTSTTTANFGGAITAAGAISGTDISGTSGAFGTLTVSGISEFNAPVTINEDLDVAGEVRLNGYSLIIADSVEFSGGFPFTATVTAPTSVTFPTSGTLSTLAGSETLTNKRIPPRITTITSSATPTVNTDNCDMVTITALAAAVTSMTTNLTGTPSNGEMLLFRIKDDGTARAITWGASFEAMGAALPTTTVLSKVLHVLFIWNSVTSKWGCLSTAQE